MLRHLGTWAIAWTFASPVAHAFTVDPTVHWRVLETPHFDIFYNREHKDLADAYAIAGEQAYDVLKNRFSELPKRTYLVLYDNTDQANGSATFLPYPMIQVFPVLPDTLTSLDYFGNWPLDMIMHEYTHILTFQPSHGFYTPLRYVFGSVIHPNGILPRWYLEGLAVESESRFTPFGRLKSPRTFAELRALVQDNKLESQNIGLINEVMVPEYPYGERPYLFGSLLWEHMVQNGPADIVERLNQDYGRRFPFLIQRPVKDIFGKKYQELLADTYAEIETGARQQIALIERKQKESFKRFADDKLQGSSPAISPDGSRLVYIASSFRRGEIRWIQRDGAVSFSGIKSEKLLPVVGSLRLSWFPDSQSFVFDAIDDMSHYHEYRELYRFDVQTRKVTQLTHELRAQEPGVSPDGKNIVFVVNGSGRQSIAVMDVASGAHRAVFEPNLSIRVSHPEFISDHEFVFTLRTREGEERLHLFNLQDGSQRELFAQEKELRRPKWTSIGLLVATTASGVENIAVADLKTQTLKPITNTATELQSADWDARAKQLIATRFTGDGPRLVSTPQTSVQPPKIGSVVKATWPEPPPPKTVDTSEFQDKSFQPLQYMWPRYWIPFAYPVYNGVYMQGSTAMQDPTGINSYLASIAYDTVTNRGGFGFQYINSSLPPDLSISFVKAENYLGASGYALEDQTAIGEATFLLPSLSRHWHLTGGYIFDRVDSPFNSGSANRQGPKAELNYSDWDDQRVEGAGTIIELAQDQFLPGPNQLEYGRSMAGFQQAWTKWLPDSHRIVVTGKAALAPQLPFGRVLEVGDTSLGSNQLVSLSNAQFLFRGYPTGEFAGRKIVNWNLEYQFPISKKTHSFGAGPLFSRGWDGAIFFDGIGVDGAAYNYKDDVYYRRDLSDIATSTGFEARWNTTVAYELPLTWILGLYFGFDERAGNNVMPFIGLAASDISNIDHLRKNWFKHL